MTTLAPTQPDPQGVRFISSEPITGATTLPEVAQQWKAKDASTPTLERVVLTGRISAEGQSPFEPSQAQFLVSVLPESGHDDPGHADNCPFCKRKAAMAPKAVVSFAGDDGQVLNVDAQQLLGLKSGDIVTIEGDVNGFELNLLSVRGKRIYISTSASKP